MELGKKTQGLIDAVNVLRSTEKEMEADYERFQVENRAVWEEVERLQAVVIDNPTEANAIAFSKAMQTAKSWDDRETTPRAKLRKIHSEVVRTENALRRAFFEEHVPLLFEVHYAPRPVPEGMLEADQDQCESPG